MSPERRADPDRLGQAYAEVALRLVSFSVRHTGTLTIVQLWLLCYVLGAVDTPHTTPPSPPIFEIMKSPARAQEKRHG